MAATAKIIILNGVGSAGKTSIARSLQTITVEPFLHVEMDSFMAMLPEAYQQHREGFLYETEVNDGKPEVVITTGPVGERTLRGMRHAIAAMAAQGNNMIVDDVMLEGEIAEYASLLVPFEMHFVGVMAPLEVLERRERNRGNRMIGLARWQVDQVHRGNTYDLEIDTNDMTAMECARRIKETFGL